MIGIVAVRVSLARDDTLMREAAPRQAMPEPDESRLKRPLQRMPADVRRALAERGVLKAYRERPAYQRNDYLAWIARAKREPTKQKRLAQMLDELEGGEVYMDMHWRPKGRQAKAEAKAEAKSRSKRA